MKLLNAIILAILAYANIVCVFTASNPYVRALNVLAAMGCALSFYLQIKKD